MEKSIDRTSYRRNARENNYENLSKTKKVNKKFRFLNFLLNQIIFWLLVAVVILTLNFFEVISLEKFIADMPEKFDVSEVFTLLKNKFAFGNLNTLITSGEYSGDASGENIIESGDFSGEAPRQEFITAVEGVNQLAEDAKIIKDNYDFFLPLKGIITSEFGCRESTSSVVSLYHTGLDIAANTGTQIFAAHDGRVTLAKSFSTYGNCVIIENGDLQTLYAHCSSLDVSEGEKIKKGEKIAKVGMTGNATGPHLHLEVRYEGRFVNPKDVLGEI